VSRNKRRDDLAKPVATLKNPDDRKVALLAARNAKMARSAHAYVRGNTIQFYRWLRARGRRAVPAAPPVWICGDCHVGNLGPIANAEGQIDIQIRDLDQTVIGNPAHDLIRLALSLASAARGSDLPGVTTAHMLEHMIEGYLRALSARSKRGQGYGPKLESIRVVMRQALDRTWKHLAKERLEDLRPTIPLGDRLGPLSKSEKKEIDWLFDQEELRRLVTLLPRKNGARVDVLDAAYWMKGCSSLGRLRCAVLLGVGKGKKADDFCLMDIKEAVPAAAPRAPGSKMPRDNGNVSCSGHGDSHHTSEDGWWRAASWIVLYSFVNCCRRIRSSKLTSWRGRRP
jgi:uncharacterized protein (DUF2252 family)